MTALAQSQPTSALPRAVWGACLVGLSSLVGCSASESELVRFSVNPESSWVVVAEYDRKRRLPLAGSFELSGGNCRLGACPVTIYELRLTSVALPDPEPSSPSFEVTTLQPITSMAEMSLVRVDTGQLELQGVSQNLTPPLPLVLSNPADFSLYLDLEAGELATSFNLAPSLGLGSESVLSVVIEASRDEASDPSSSAPEVFATATPGGGVSAEH